MSDRQTTDADARILEQAFRAADEFYDFPHGRAYTAEQRSLVTALAYRIAKRRGWAPKEARHG